MTAFSLGSSQRTRPVSVAALCLLMAHVNNASSLPEFAACIGARGQGQMCQLDAGTYELREPLFIGRSNITIKGATNSAKDTVLRRAPGYTNNLMRDTFPDSLNSITIRDFTFDGNRGAQTEPWDKFQPSLFLLSAKSALITNTSFINSPASGFGILGDRGTATGIVVNKSTFDNNAIFGIWSGNSLITSVDAGKHLLCGDYKYATDIVVAGSTFENTGANALFMEAHNVQVVGNTFRNNHKDAPFNISGGQVDFPVCANNIAIVGNTLRDGPSTPNGWWVHGIEGHAPNMAIVNNLVTGHAASALTLHGIQNVFVANWDRSSGSIGNNKRGSFPGILINDRPGWRSTDMVVIDNAIAVDGHSFGIGFHDERPSGAVINRITITNNCLTGNLNGAIQTRPMGPDVVIQNNAAQGCGPR